MKDQIVKYLLENTIVEGKYVGGGDEPQMVVFAFSEDIDIKSFINQVAEDIEGKILESQQEETPVTTPVNLMVVELFESARDYMKVQDNDKANPMMMMDATTRIRKAIDAIQIINDMCEAAFKEEVHQQQNDLKQDYESNLS